jgi:hypothetical protein
MTDGEKNLSLVEVLERWGDLTHPKYSITHEVVIGSGDRELVYLRIGMPPYSCPCSTRCTEPIFGWNYEQHIPSELNSARSCRLF